MATLTGTRTLVGLLFTKSRTGRLTVRDVRIKQYELDAIKFANTYTHFIPEGDKVKIPPWIRSGPEILGTLRLLSSHQDRRKLLLSRVIDERQIRNVSRFIVNSVARLGIRLLYLDLIAHRRAALIKLEARLKDIRRTIEGRKRPRPVVLGSDLNIILALRIYKTIFGVGILSAINWKRMEIQDITDTFDFLHNFAAAVSVYTALMDELKLGSIRADWKAVGIISTSGSKFVQTRSRPTPRRPRYTLAHTMTGKAVRNNISWEIRGGTYRGFRRDDPAQGGGIPAVEQITRRYINRPGRGIASSLATRV